jgi:hypothetical protein
MYTLIGAIILLVIIGLVLVKKYQDRLEKEVANKLNVNIKK